MSQLMQLQIENERTFLTYKYKKVQDIDDVILQLLNEADIEGFAESHMNKAKSTVNYDVTGYRKWSEIPSDERTPEMMASTMENLYQLLAYLEDSFIDIEYVLLDKEYIYVNPGNGKLVILVVPCQAVVDEEYTLTDCVRQMFEQFTYGEGECAEQLKSCLQQEVHALETLKELADILRAYDAENGRVTPAESIRGDAANENDIIDVSEEIQPDAEPEETGETVSDEPAVSEETVILEAIAEEADQIKTESANIAADAEYMRSQLREDMRRELEKELREQIREETRRELEAELRESIRVELEEEQNQAETADQKMPYLIRKKTGEIISLNKQTFIIGKLDTCCDYVIRGNRAISRLHAVIKYKEDTDSYFIVDCNSTNHIYLNGRQIEAEQPETLEDGMHIHLALEEFVFQLR